MHEVTRLQFPRKSENAYIKRNAHAIRNVIPGKKLDQIFKCYRPRDIHYTDKKGTTDRH